MKRLTHRRISLADSALPSSTPRSVTHLGVLPLGLSRWVGPAMLHRRERHCEERHSGERHHEEQHCRERHCLGLHCGGSDGFCARFRRLCRLSLSSFLGILTVLIGLSTEVSWAQSRPQIWSGTGQIISGQGQGATVQLTLEVGNGYIRTRSGPPLDTRYNRGSQPIKTDDGMWQIEHQGDQLSVILHRSDQVIRYQLTPSPIPTASSRPNNDVAPSSVSPQQLVPQSHGPARLPLVPVVRDVIVVPRLEPASNNE